MTTRVNWANPYEENTGAWYRGNLHAHSSPASVCSEISMGDLLDGYVRAGIRFLAITDHRTVSEPRRDELILLPGMEWDNSAGRHTNIIGLDKETVRQAAGITEQEQLLGSFGGKDTLLILNHPNWELTPHYRREQMAALEGFDGIEIYNHVIERLPGSALATDKWDYLLSTGKRVLGFANDDSHTAQDVGGAWNTVRAASPTPEAIFHALRTGNFYCSTGVVLSDIRVEGGEVVVESENAEEMEVIGHAGCRLHRARDKAIRFRPDPGVTRYLRFAAYGPGASMAWTQPFFPH